MDMYVANCTKQNQVICFRLDFEKDGSRSNREIIPHSHREIKAGQQVRIRDLHIDQCETIRKQLEPFGLLAVKEINHANGVVPYIFNIEKAVSADHIRQMLSHNSTELLARGKALRQKAAMSVHDLFNSTLAQQLAKDNLPVPEEPIDIDVEHEQIEQSEADESRIEEGLRVSSTAPGPRQQPAPQKPKRGRPAKPRN